ncbi:hypothetical protein PM082_014649 [Marasmius tenuissimus]|nr:hypothetical protein PM082_014649 [Marasmius tenuissimus]
MLRHKLVLQLLYVLLLLPVDCAQFSITFSTEVTVCQSVVIIWSDGLPPFRLTVQAGEGDSSFDHPLSIYDGWNNNATWVAQFPPGTPLIFCVWDSAGASVETPLVIVQEAHNISCSLVEINRSSPITMLPPNLHDETSTPNSTTSAEGTILSTSLISTSNQWTREYMDSQNWSATPTRAGPGDQRETSDIPMIVTIVVSITLGLSVLVGGMLLWHCCRRRLPVDERAIIPYILVNASTTPLSRKQSSSTSYNKVDTVGGNGNARASPVNRRLVARARPASDGMQPDELSGIDEREGGGRLRAPSYDALDPPPSYRS